MNVQDLLAQLAMQKTAAAPEEAKAAVAPVTSPVEPVAPAADAGHDKLAADLYAGGALFGEGFADRVIEKLAAVAAGGAGMQQGSKWQKVTNRISALNGEKQGVPAAGPSSAEAVPDMMHGNGHNKAKYPA